MSGRDEEEPPVGARRHEVLLAEQLERVGEGLQHAVPAGAHRAPARLHVAEPLALAPHHDDGVDQHDDREHDDAEECLEHASSVDLPHDDVDRADDRR